MSLSTREQQALEGIENRLAADPKLAALLVTFARLTSGEAMPAREEVREDARLPGRWTRRVFRRARRLLAAYAGLDHALALLWVLVAVGVIAVAVALSGGGRAGACVRSWPVTCTAPASAHLARAAVPSTS